MLKELLRLFKADRRLSEQKRVFNNIMGFAHEILRDNPPLLPELLRLLARVTQSQCFTQFLRSKTTEEMLDSKRLFKFLWFDPDLPLAPDGVTLNTLKVSLNIHMKISLRTDPVLALPWKSVVRMLDLALAVREKQEQWRQDANHIVQVWLPMGIAFVAQGHHSVTSGILAGEGEVMTDTVYDIGAIYDYIYTNGVNYIKKADGKALSPVRNVEFAAILELGRILV